MGKLVYYGIGAGAIGLAVVSSLWLGADAPPAFVPSPEEAVVQPLELHTVYVSGAVAMPGMVALPPGSRVADAVVAAGGALPTAVEGVLNYAARVHDGQHVHVPDEGRPAPAGSSRPPAVPVNSASASDLQVLPGVGPVLAQRIVEYRAANGPFAQVEDLLDVPGIGEAKLASLRDHVAIP